MVDQHAVGQMAVCHKLERAADFVLKPMVGGLGGGMVVYAAIDARYVAHRLQHTPHIMAHEKNGALLAERLKEGNNILF